MNKIICKQLPRELEEIELYAVADLHAGDTLSRMDEFMDFITFILERENRYIITLGDLMNNNLKSSVGSVYEDIIPPNQQKKEIVRQLEPARERILAMTGGNHEERTKKDADQDITEEIAYRVGATYAEDEIVLKLSFGEKPHNGKPQVYTIYASHGCAGGRKPGNALNWLVDMSGNIFADLYFAAHKHQRSSHRQIFRLPDLHNNNIREVEQLFVLTPSWLGYGGYARRRQYSPQVRGAAKVVLQAAPKKTICEV